jgi:hypothetical protein
MQELEVELDANLQCPGCTIRLMRQALEWGDSYKFMSCANVDIVKVKKALIGTGLNPVEEQTYVKCVEVFFL